MTRGIVAYSAYVPGYRLDGAELAAAHGAPPIQGKRVVCAFDEDSSTMAVAAARAALGTTEVRPSSLYLATTSPVYADKTNAVTVHAALALESHVFAADLAGSARGSVAAFKAAAWSGGLAVLADVRTGRPASADETSGGDGAAAFVFADPGSGADVIAELVAEASATEEFLDRWREPGQAGSLQWEERFGLERYLPLITQASAAALAAAGIERADHVVLVSPNTAVTKRAGKLIPGRLSAGGSPLGHAGAADLGLALAAVLDIAGPDESILVLSAADGCDAMVFRTTKLLGARRQTVRLADQLCRGINVAYPKYLSWRGILAPEPPRRPEPDRPAGPPSSRARHWKYAFEGGRCQECGFVHLPPARVCKRCGAVDRMAGIRLSAGPGTGTIATYTVDKLAFSPSPPMVNAVIDFDGGGRYTMEVADCKPEQLAVGARVELTFRSLFVAGGVRDYFWKVRLLTATDEPTETTAEALGETDVREPV
ncbi:OB-fold domain-containing protein [bacterium RCC_150]